MKTLTVEEKEAALRDALAAVVRLWDNGGNLAGAIHRAKTVLEAF